ncbi:MAG: sensor histidine kinase [Chloroflexota bacterium]
MADLQRREAERAATFAAIADGIIVFDARGQVLRMNRSAEHLLGVSTAQFMAMSPAERVQRLRVATPEGQPVPTDRTPLAMALRGVMVVSSRCVVYRADGQAQHILNSAAPIKDAQGMLLGAVLTMSDINQIVELERQRGEIISIVAHDLRQPLSIIQGQAELAEHALAVNNTALAKKSDEAILVSARRMNVMIENLVDSVRMEAGRLELRRQPINLGRFLTDLLQRASASLETDRVRISVPENVPLVSADSDRLERMMLNLLSNALKYSSPGAPVEVAVRPLGHDAQISVRDRGAGIAAEDLPHIFERFYRTKGPHVQESVGLGLYITKTLVEAHGGRIWAESKPGKGSTFYFTLPLA